MQRWTVYLLAVAFSGSFFKCAELLIRGGNSADRFLFDRSAMGWLAVAALLLTMALDAGALWSLFARRHRRTLGTWLCLASIGVSAAFTSGGFAIARANPDLAREAFVVSRTSRGLPVREEALDMAANQTNILAMWLASLAISALLAYLAIRYHSAKARMLSSPSSPPAAARR